MPDNLMTDRLDVAEVRHRFAVALDTRDWALFASLFADRVDVDLSALGVPAATMHRTEVVALFQHSFRRPREEMGTQQLYGNVTVSVTADTATSRSYLLGHHHVPGMTGGEDVELRGAYHDSLVRTSGGWQITATTLDVFSITGNARIFT